MENLSHTVKASGSSHIVGGKIRFIIVQYHLFKNAGTTFNAVLERNFPRELAYLHGERSDASLRGRDLVAFLEANPQIRAVSSHHLRPPSPKAEEFVFFDVVSVRHPLDRLRSVYDFYHRSPEGEDPVIGHARKTDIAGFLGLLLDRFPHLVNNVQVNYFANGGRYTRPADELDLKRAFDDICGSAVPITAELFDVSVVAGEYFLQPAFGTLDFSYTPENVTPNRLPGLEERLKTLKKSCGAGLYEDLLKANELDVKLIGWVEKEIRRRFAQIPQGNRRLQNLRERCRNRIP